jgi:hypothetical protein
LFDVLGYLVANPVVGANFTPAVLFRVIHETQPTVLVDEIDSQLRDREKGHDLRSILNAGYRRGPAAKVFRCHPTTLKPQEFEVFCPKAFAGIGAHTLHQRQAEADQEGIRARLVRQRVGALPPRGR